ncbi:prephenate dehydratase [Pontibacter sp. SGAir0037]|uniref:prephenate dehydratase n=1 Tax=Pontibacter sp. SGAir0037 TaxID=2571030 RepID=UPI0010CCD8D9|nr:prephenate dehydratase domain-containing protein [Pontibacter sp. SGAir0037]QCR23055.1 hypothetical protein C1N53_12355 [Pontibacter sp. SGAir0037]
MAKHIKIAIQGGPASFHDTAARQYFSQDVVDILPCDSFVELCDALQDGTVDYAVMAIVNALAGSILTNYSLLQHHNFSIIGERWLSIDQNLIALPGTKLQDIHTVSSHPVALLQCGNFLKHHAHMLPQESSDTADSVRAIKEKNLAGAAAIASKQAAILYDMEILEPNIADRKDNYTRFLVLSREPQKSKAKPADKASLILQVPHVGSSLGAVINKLYLLDMHISQIQSIPAPPLNTNHNVAIDLEHPDLNKLLVAIEELRPLVLDLQILGLYHTAENPLELENKVSLALIDNSLN